jgi:hypothetical protein
LPSETPIISAPQRVQVALLIIHRFLDAMEPIVVDDKVVMPQLGGASHLVYNASLDVIGDYLTGRGQFAPPGRRRSAPRKGVRREVSHAVGQGARQA